MPQVLREPSAASPPVRAVRLVTPDCALEPRPDGALLIRARGELAAYPDKITERPIAILSGNDIEHALLALAAAYVGIPHAPISPAYSLVSSDFGKLRHVVNLLTPGLVFAADGAAFRRAIEAVVAPDVEIV